MLPCFTEVAVRVKAISESALVGGRVTCHLQFPLVYIDSNLIKLESNHDCCLPLIRVAG